MNARNFLITMNKASMDGYEKTLEYLRERGCNYYLSCLEENSNEELHIHIYVQFPKQVRLSPTKCYKAHIDVCRGSEEDNVNYVRKIQDTFGIHNILDEYGTIRRGVGQNQHSLMAYELAELPFEEVPAQHFKTWVDVKGVKSHTVEELEKRDVKVHYIWGPSGCGKSKSVIDHYKGTGILLDQVKYANGFWLNVNWRMMPEVAWYDDFRSSSMPAAEFINFIDYNVHPLNVKNHSNVLNFYKEIWITSIEDPYEIYRNVSEETREEWIRRMEIIHMDYENK